MVVSYNKKDMVSFGNYLLSPERTKRKEQSTFPVDQVSHADFENWEHLKSKKPFKKGDRILFEDLKYQCIMSDDEYALFGEFTMADGESSVDFTSPIIFSNKTQFLKDVDYTLIN